MSGGEVRRAEVRTEDHSEEFLRERAVLAVDHTGAHAQVLLVVQKELHCARLPGAARLHAPRARPAGKQKRGHRWRGRVLQAVCLAWLTLAGNCGLVARDASKITFIHQTDWPMPSLLVANKPAVRRRGPGRLEPRRGLAKGAGRAGSPAGGPPRGLGAAPRPLRRPARAPAWVPAWTPAWTRAARWARRPRGGCLIRPLTRMVGRRRR